MAAWMLISGGLFLGGCGIDLLPPDGDVTATEPNDNFSQAQKVSADELGLVRITGSLSSNDCDVFSLGSFQGGETISIRLKSSNGFLNGYTSVALFDKDRNLAYLERDLSGSSMFEEVFTHTVRMTGVYFLAICKTDSSSLGTVNYELEVDVGSTLPPLPSGQRVYLDFTGGDIEIGGLRFSSLKPFSEIDLGYDPEILADDIRMLVEADFNSLKVDFFSSYGQSAPASPYSTVHITASSGDYFGLADAVDWYDADPRDNAVVFAGLLARTGISRARFVQSTANVVSHELGHLLGLSHTNDDSELMDQATPTSLLEQDQEFSRAVLATDEFPIGYQDAMELLAFAVGLL
jgi:hypothetical protein